jgi:hypothetical protein
MNSVNRSFNQPQGLPEPGRSSVLRHLCYSQQERRKALSEIDLELDGYEVKRYRGWEQWKWWTFLVCAAGAIAVLMLTQGHWFFAICFTSASLSLVPRLRKVVPKEPPPFLQNRREGLRLLNNDELKELESLTIKSTIIRRAVQQWVSEKRPLLVRDLDAIRPFFEHEQHRIARDQMLEQLSKPR